MITYIAMFLYPAFSDLVKWSTKGLLASFHWILVGLALILLIGLRHEVGGDWLDYLNNKNYGNLGGLSLSEALTTYFAGDVAYILVHWLSVNYGYGIYSTNLFCAALLVFGLLRLCRRMPYPWIALAVSVPVLVILAGMGYTRQGAAMGLVMLGLVSLMQNDFFKYLCCVALACLFHKTAIFLLPIAFIYNLPNTDRRALIVYGVAVLVLAMVVFWVLGQRFLLLFRFYIVENLWAGYDLTGAISRMSLTVVAASFLLLFRDAWRKRFNDYYLWLGFSTAIFLLLFLLPVASVVADRLSFWLIPLQLVVFSRLPILISDRYFRSLFVVTTLSVYLLALLVWLNFATHAYHWLPYSNILFL